jgi:hypothetical protein
VHILDTIDIMLYIRISDALALNLNVQ